MTYEPLTAEQVQAAEQRAHLAVLAAWQRRQQRLQARAARTALSPGLLSVSPR